MNEAPSSLPADAPAHDRSAINRLLLFFAIVYVVEGLGQVGGLIAQPLSYYLKQEQGWTPSQVSAYLTIFNFPWIIKPVYGVFSDFVPLFGYRRKGYLVAANIVATGAFLWVTQLYSPSHLVWALEATAYAMAISSTVCGAVLVENGQKLGESGRFVNQQWLWFNVAAMASAIGGGALTQLLPPTSALHVAAAIVAVAPLAVLFGAIFLIPEQPARIDLPALRCAAEAKSTRAQESDRLVAREQIEELPQRRAARGGEVRIAAEHEHGILPRRLEERAVHFDAAIWKPGIPLCRVPSTSPSPFQPPAPFCRRRGCRGRARRAGSRRRACRATAAP
jgi:hypothetical protein